VLLDGDIGGCSYAKLLKSIASGHFMYEENEKAVDITYVSGSFVSLTCEAHALYKALLKAKPY
jgi:hypothetical protein